MRRWLVAVRSFAFIAIVAGAGLGWAQTNEADFVEGIEFHRVDSSYTPKVAGDKVEVIEFFWYGCPHCNRFEPLLEGWRAEMPDYVSFRRVAAPLNPNWTVHAKAFYAARELGIADQAHADLFAAIHDQGRALDSADALAAFYSGYGVDKETFKDTMRSFQVDRHIREALSMARKLGVRSVPTVVIAGRYRTDGTSAGGFPNLLKVMDFLVQRAHDGARG